MGYDSKLYQLWIVLKYNYYKLYWKFKKPAKRSKFYGWSEESREAVNNVGVVYGVKKNK